MITWTRWIALSLLATSIVWSLGGCGGNVQTPKGADTHEHKEGEHKHDGDKEGGHAHALTEHDVQMPASFKAGVARLEELHGQIKQHIDHGDLAKVPHPAAEEMALVAKKMKDLARSDLPEDKQTDAGRLCNEIVAQYNSIDEAADAGKKAETQAVHDQMTETIKKLKALLA